MASSGRTSIPLEFAPYGSVFVVFRKRAAKPAKRIQHSSVLAKIEGPWTLRFDPKWGGPESIEFAELESWTKRPEEGVKYYAGTATYRKSFTFTGKPGQRILLDLGEVKEIAAVRLNGKQLDTVWTKPFRVDITTALIIGHNNLEIEVVNLWPNRLIRDGQLPPDKRLTTTNVKTYYQPQSSGHKLLESGLLGPVQLLAAD